MRFSKLLGIALLLLVAQLSALASELAVLRNGFSIRHERREQIGKFTRLYTADQQGFIDILTESIASFEPVEDIPVAPAASAPTTSAATLQPAAVQRVPLAPIANQVDINQLIRDASGRYRLDPDFVASVIKAESNFQPRAVSPKGAQGLMQLMPATAALLGVSNPFDPKANVDAGTAYLSQLLDQYNNDPIKALAAYNAGPHRVQQYHGVPPYRETKAYVARIVNDFNAKKRAQGKVASDGKKDVSQDKNSKKDKSTNIGKTDQQPSSATSPATLSSIK
ncbi:MAG TPA: lytic transglycosylase domain-containing protein [Candidatus Angelobacter sp.]|jgi:soluble lytic murein transglycosylase-like protein|nr:lytic transglycosylase domain-containing protein [Candidatus Angelobacter sp.]